MDKKPSELEIGLSRKTRCRGSVIKDTNFFLKLTGSNNSQDVRNSNDPGPKPDFLLTMLISITGGLISMLIWNMIKIYVK